MKPKSPLWNFVFDESDYHGFSKRVCEQGRVCLAFRDSFCKDYADSYGFETLFEGQKAFAMGIYMFGSEAFGKRLKQYPLCLSFVYDGIQWTVGLYSENIDVGKIARKHGGGGHTGAAGFVCKKLPFKKYQELTMPYTENQIAAAKVALAAKRGKIKVGDLKKAAKSMYESMTEEELEEFIAEGVKGD